MSVGALVPEYMTERQSVSKKGFRGKPVDWACLACRYNSHCWRRVGAGIGGPQIHEDPVESADTLLPKNGDDVDPMQLEISCQPLLGLCVTLTKPANAPNAAIRRHYRHDENM